MVKDNRTGFPKLSAPASRALAAAGYTRLDQLADVSEADLEKLHGLGEKAIAALGEALHERGLSFRSSAPPSAGAERTPSAADEVDEYLRGVEEPQHSVLQALRRTILEIIPEAEQVISYGLPAFRLHGRTVAGFGAFKDHMSYLPFSGSVLEQLGDELHGYTMTKSSLHFSVHRPLKKGLVKRLIDVRLAEGSQRSN